MKSVRLLLACYLMEPIITSLQHYQHVIWGEMGLFQTRNSFLRIQRKTRPRFYLHAINQTITCRKFSSEITASLVFLLHWPENRHIYDIPAWCTVADQRPHHPDPAGETFETQQLLLSSQNLRGNHLMVGAHCTAKVSTQQHSMCRPWAPAKPFPTSSIICQESPWMNAPSYKPTTVQSVSPAHTPLPHSCFCLCQTTWFCSHEHFLWGQPGTTPELYQIKVIWLLVRCFRFSFVKYK